MKTTAQYYTDNPARYQNENSHYFADETSFSYDAQSRLISKKRHSYNYKLSIQG